MYIYARGCTCIGRHLKETVVCGIIMWSEKGKQNKQAKKILFIFMWTSLITDRRLSCLNIVLVVNVTFNTGLHEGGGRT